MISISFTRKNDSRVVSAPFLREYIYYGGCFLPVSRSANEAVFSVPFSMEHRFSLTSRGRPTKKEVSLPLKWVAKAGSHPKSTEEVARVRVSGLRDVSSHGAEQDMPISG